MRLQFIHINLHVAATPSPALAAASASPVTCQAPLQHPVVLLTQQLSGRALKKQCTCAFAGGAKMKDWDKQDDSSDELPNEDLQDVTDSDTDGGK